jgi:hypothetical protein
MRKQGRGTGGYWRTIAVGVASLGLLLVGLRPASGATASTAAPTGAAFSNGQAKATAVVTRMAPGVGNLELAIGSGIAVAELKNELAQAQAQAFDLGLIGTTLTAGSCRESSITEDDLPQPTRVDNRRGDATARADQGEVAGDSLGGGRMSVAATKVPSATAVATTAASEGPAVTVGGGRATAVTEVVDKIARQAHATVEMDLDLAGIVQLSNLRWDALHRTGKGAVAEASFDVGTARLLGAPVPIESLEALETAVNTALELTGVSVTFPHVERFTEPTDLVRITPMLITLRDSQAGKTVIGPGLNATREQREQLFVDLSEAFCDAAGILLVGDIGVSIVSGTGFLTYAIGGAEAISGEFVSEDPFGSPIAPPGGPVIPPASGLPPVGTPATPPAAPAAPTRGPAPQPIADVGPLEELCETVHPFEWPDCSEGAMAPLGLLGLAATALVGGLDWQHQRRRLRATGAEDPPGPAAAS